MRSKQSSTSRNNRPQQQNITEQFNADATSGAAPFSGLDKPVSIKGYCESS
jgi:hypothetical protein